MAGAVFECTKCGKEIRSGYPSYAVQFAASKRGASEAEIIEDFFDFNKQVRQNLLFYNLSYRIFSWQALKL